MKSRAFGSVMGILAGIGLLVSVIALLPAVSQAIEYRLEDFLILVDDQLIIRGYADVICCGGGIGTGGIPRRSDLGSRNFAEMGGKGWTKIPTVAPTVKDVAVIAPTVKLGNWARVSHVIYDGVGGSFTDVGFTGRVGPTIKDPNIGTFPDFPSFPAFTPGVADVVIPVAGTVTLTPGSYRDLIIKTNGKVHFTFGVDGMYNFRRIITTSASSYKLIFDDDDIQINVQDFVRLSEYGDFNPTGAEGITLYVAGIDDGYGGANKNRPGVYGPPAAFEYDGDGLFIACFVFVKNGTMNLKGVSHTSFWATQWFGKSLQEVSTLRITLKHPGEVCFEQAPISVTKSCAEISGDQTTGNALVTFTVTVTNTTTDTVTINSIVNDPPATIVGTFPVNIGPNQSAQFEGSYVLHCDLSDPSDPTLGGCLQLQPDGTYAAPDTIIVSGQINTIPVTIPVTATAGAACRVGFD